MRQLRDSRGLQYYNKLPDYVRANYSFVVCSGVKRDTTHISIGVYSNGENDEGTVQWIVMNRKTGEIKYPFSVPDNSDLVMVNKGGHVFVRLRGENEEPQVLNPPIGYTVICDS